MEIRSKKALEIELSRLKGFIIAKVSSEQYITPSSIAAEVLWKAHLLGEVRDKTIVDLGCGSGILGIGALLLGAKKVIFVDNDDSKKILRIISVIVFIFLPSFISFSFQLIYTISAKKCQE